jgi:hypothetical protein
MRHTLLCLLLAGCVASHPPQVPHTQCEVLVDTLDQQCVEPADGWANWFRCDCSIWSQADMIYAAEMCRTLVERDGCYLVHVLGTACKDVRLNLVDRCR